VIESLKEMTELIERVKKRLELAKADQGVYAKFYREDMTAVLKLLEETCEAVQDGLE
jgi:hypothetical protein